MTSGYSGRSLLGEAQSHFLWEMLNWPEAAGDIPAQDDFSSKIVYSCQGGS